MNDIFVWSTIILAIWAAIGPLVGVRYGQELAKRWQKQHWISENRKEECKGLLNLMADDYHANNFANSSRASSEDHARSKQATLNLSNGFMSCIFLAKEVERLKLQDRFIHLKYGHQMTSEDREKGLDTLFGELRRLVL